MRVADLGLILLAWVCASVVVALVLGRMLRAAGDEP
jgi:hypothetical protein